MSLQMTVDAETGEILDDAGNGIGTTLEDMAEGKTGVPRFKVHGRIGPAQPIKRKDGMIEMRLTFIVSEALGPEGSGAVQAAVDLLKAIPDDQTLELEVRAPMLQRSLWDGD